MYAYSIRMRDSNYSTFDNFITRHENAFIDKNLYIYTKFV